VRPLVPDVAYLSYVRMGDATDDELEAPTVPPNVVVEVRSPEDRQARIDHKIGVYLAAGADRGRIWSSSSIRMSGKCSRTIAPASARIGLETSSRIRCFPASHSRSTSCSTSSAARANVRYVFTMSARERVRGVRSGRAVGPMRSAGSTGGKTRSPRRSV
jgi:hypothetical protein